LKAGAKLFIGFCWCPSADKNKLFFQLTNLKDQSRIEIPAMVLIHEHSMQPPTYFKTNEFTWAFQEIVNTYGMPTYKEVNPGVFTCVTFPFLFGVMFGDVGHGAVMCLIGMLLCLFNSKIKEKAAGMEAILQARYMVLLMGFFATFCGLIYNDLMALPIFARWGPTCYTIDKPTTEQ